MAKLSIGIGVDLGNSLQGINSLIASLTALNTEVSKLSSNLSVIKNIKATPTITVTTKNISQNNVVNSSTGNISQPTLKPVPDIFSEYRRGVSSAATVTEFLKSKQVELEAEIQSLQQTAGSAKGIKDYEQILSRIAAKKGELQAVTKTLNNVGTVGAQGLNRLSGAGNQANLVLTNVGRIAQDSAFGILGISNNINPLVESFSQLRKAANESNQSIGKALLSSLTGPGGLTLAFSAVTAALSFASVGLSYWFRSNEEAKDSTDRLKEAEKQLEEQLKQTNDTIQLRTNYGDYLKDLNLLLAKGRGATKQELRKIEDDFFKSNERIASTDQFGNVIYQYKGAILQAQEDANNAADTFKKSVVDKLQKVGASEATIRQFQSNYWVDAVSGYANFIDKFGKQGKAEVQKLRENYNEKQNVLGQLQQQYAVIQATRKVEDITDSKKTQSTKTLSDLDKYNAAIKELYADIEKIRSSPILSIDEKNKKIIEAIRNGLLNISDLYPKLFKADSTKDIAKLTEIFKVESIRKFGVEAKKAFSDLGKDIKNINIVGSILNKSTIDEQINAVSSKIKDYANTISLLTQFKIGGADSVMALNEELQNTFIYFGVLKTALASLQDKKIAEELTNIWNKYNEKVTKSITLTQILNDVSKKVNRNPFRIEQDKLQEDISSTEALLSKAIDSWNEAMKASNNQPTWLTTMLEDEIERLKKLLESLGIKFNVEKLKSDIQETFEKEITDAFRTSFQDLFAGIGEILAGANVKDVFGNIFGKLTESLGKSLIKFALQTEKVQKVVEGLKKLIGTSAGWFAIGAALAIGTALIAVSKMSMKGFASGGFVSGEGTSTSDSIPAMLSDKEYVIKASSVNKYGVGFMDRINSGTFDMSKASKFALGGLVGSNMIMSNPSVSLGSSFGQSTGYIAETKISGQDLKLVLTRADRRFNNVT